MIAVGGVCNPGPGIVSANVPTGAPIGIIRWDATSFNTSLSWYSVAGFPAYFPSSAQFNFRKPAATVYAPELGTTPQWDNGQIFGSGVDTQKIIDQELAYAKGKIDFYIFDWYPPAELLDPGDEAQQSDIMLAYNAYMNSVIRNACGVKFCFLIQYSWYNYKSGKYIAAFNNWFNTKLNDSMYMKINTTQRLVIVYNDGWAAQAAKWSTFKTAVGSNIFGWAVTDAATANNLGLQGLMTYGPNGALPSGSGQGPWSAQVTKDTSTWGALPGQQRVSSVTPVQDRRSKVPSTKYIDLPTRPQLVTHLTNAKANSGTKGIPIYATSEICEGGNPWDAGIYDCCQFVRGGYKPQSYTYETDCHTAATAGTANAVILSGTGWTYQSNIQGAYHNDEMWTSTSGDKVTLNAHDNLLAFDVIGSTSPATGTATVKVDGSTVGTINFAGSSAVRQTLFSYTIPGPVAAHTVEVICDGTGQIRCDCFKPTYKP